MAEDSNKGKLATSSTSSSATNTQSALHKILASSAPDVDKNRNRVEVIVAIAKIDSNITKLLVKYLTPSLHEDEDDLLDESKPLGSMILKAKLCLRLGLISPTLYTIIKDLSKIRNRCAHRDDHFDAFSVPEIKGKIDYLYNQFDTELLEDSQKNKTTQYKFENICWYINSYFSINKFPEHVNTFANKEILFV